MNKYNLLGALAFTTVLSSEINAQTTYSWSPAGPVLSAGRSRNMIVDKNNSNVLYVGSVSSGIFKSTDGAANWAPLNDQGTVRNISYMAQAADGTIYASTGEGFLRPTARARAQAGTGLYKLNTTTNTLDNIAPAATVGTVITRIACHPTNANNIAVAGDNGLEISTDGGASFVQASGDDITPTATALTVSYDATGAIYATLTNNTSGGGVNLYKSASGSPSGFVKITPTNVNLPNSNYGRIEFAISSNNAAVIYASVSKPTSPSSNASSASLMGFFVSKDAGTTWNLILEGSPQLDPLSNGGSINSGDYAHSVIIDPSNDDIVYIGSYKFYRWAKTAGGPEGVGTWTRFGNELFFNTPLYLRHNIHDIKIVGSGSSRSYYFVTDAGVYKSIDNLLTFQPFFKGLGTAQYNSIGITAFPKTANTNSVLTPYSCYIAGTGGNGVSYFSGNYPSVTNELNYLTGDFFNVQYSRINPNTAFFAAANSNLYIAADITANEPNLMQASHLGTQCGPAPNITTIDFRGITNNGSTTEDVYSNNTYTSTGTPFKLWESNGSLNTIDSALFFNDSIQVLIPVTSTVDATPSFTVSLIKPQKNAILDKITIRTFTIGVPTSTSNSCFAFTTKSYTATQKATMEFGGASSATAQPSSYTLTGLTSTVANTQNTLSIDAAESKDVIQFQLPTNPLAAISSFSNDYMYVRVGVTVFYKYNAGSKIMVENENISNKVFKDSTVLSSALSWSFANVGTNSLAPVSTGSPLKFKMPYNARLAIINDKGIMISKRPLNVNDPQKFQVVSCNGAITTNSTSFTSNTITIAGQPYLLEWAPDGKSIYFVTNQSNTTFNVYKINLKTSIHDFAIEDYRGAFYTGCVNSKRTSTSVFTFSTNFNSRFRTTLIGSFSERITNLAVSDNSKTLLLTTSDITSANSKRIYVSSPNIDVDNIDNTVVTFTDKTGTLPQIATYCALFEYSDNKRVLLGTENGVYATDDITVASPTWFSAKSASTPSIALPNVQVFDIKQQKTNTWESYNSGVIYVATNGRGAWMNKNFLQQTVIGVNEYESKAKNTGLMVYPNPTNSNVTLNFFATENENVVVNVMDINGKLLKSEKINNLSYGYTDKVVDVSDLTSGVYIVNVSSSAGIKRVAKLVVSK